MCMFPTSFLLLALNSLVRNIYITLFLLVKKISSNCLKQLCIQDACRDENLQSTMFQLVLPPNKPYVLITSSCIQPTVTSQAKSVLMYQAVSKRQPGHTACIACSQKQFYHTGVCLRNNEQAKQVGGIGHRRQVAGLRLVVELVVERRAVHMAAIGNLLKVLATRACIESIHPSQH